MSDEMIPSVSVNMKTASVDKQSAPPAAVDGSLLTTSTSGEDFIMQMETELLNNHEKFAKSAVQNSDACSSSPIVEPLLPDDDEAMNARKLKDISDKLFAATSHSSTSSDDDDEPAVRSQSAHQATHDCSYAKSLRRDVKEAASHDTDQINKDNSSKCHSLEDHDVTMERDINEPEITAYSKQSKKFLSNGKQPEISLLSSLSFSDDESPTIMSKMKIPTNTIKTASSSTNNSGSRQHQTSMLKSQRLTICSDSDEDVDESSSTQHGPISDKASSLIPPEILAERDRLRSLKITQQRAQASSLIEEVDRSLRKNAEILNSVEEDLHTYCKKTQLLQEKVVKVPTCDTNVTSKSAKSMQKAESVDSLNMYVGFHHGSTPCTKPSMRTPSAEKLPRQTEHEKEKHLDATALLSKIRNSKKIANRSRSNPVPMLGSPHEDSCSDASEIDQEEIQPSISKSGSHGAAQAGVRAGAAVHQNRGNRMTRGGTSPSCTVSYNSKKRNNSTNTQFSKNSIVVKSPQNAGVVSKKLNRNDGERSTETTGAKTCKSHSARRAENSRILANTIQQLFSREEDTEEKRELSTSQIAHTAFSASVAATPPFQNVLGNKSKKPPPKDGPVQRLQKDLRFLYSKNKKLLEEGCSSSLFSANKAVASTKTSTSIRDDTNIDVLSAKDYILKGFSKLTIVEPPHEGETTDYVEGGKELAKESTGDDSVLLEAEVLRTAAADLFGDDFTTFEDEMKSYHLDLDSKEEEARSTNVHSAGKGTFSLDHHERHQNSTVESNASTRDISNGKQEYLLVASAKDMNMNKTSGVEVDSIMGRTTNSNSCAATTRTTTTATTSTVVTPTAHCGTTGAAACERQQQFVSNKTQSSGNSMNTKNLRRAKATRVENNAASRQTKTQFSTTATASEAPSSTRSTSTFVSAHAARRNSATGVNQMLGGDHLVYPNLACEQDDISESRAGGRGGGTTAGGGNSPLAYHSVQQNVNMRPPQLGNSGGKQGNQASSKASKPPLDGNHRNIAGAHMKSFTSTKTTAIRRTTCCSTSATISDAGDHHVRRNSGSSLAASSSSSSLGINYPHHNPATASSSISQKDTAPAKICITAPRVIVSVPHKSNQKPTNFRNNGSRREGIGSRNLNFKNQEKQTPGFRHDNFAGAENEIFYMSTSPHREEDSHNNSAEFDPLACTNEGRLDDDIDSRKHSHKKRAKSLQHVGSLRPDAALISTQNSSCNVSTASLHSSSAPFRPRSRVAVGVTSAAGKGVTPGRQSSGRIGALNSRAKSVTARPRQSAEPVSFQIGKKNAGACQRTASTARSSSKNKGKNKGKSGTSMVHASSSRHSLSFSETRSTRKAKAIKPEWNDTFSDMSRYRLDEKTLRRRQDCRVSKNHEQAAHEVHEKISQMEHDIRPFLPRRHLPGGGPLQHQQYSVISSLSTCNSADPSSANINNYGTTNSILHSAASLLLEEIPAFSTFGKNKYYAAGSTEKILVNGHRPSPAFSSKVDTGRMPENKSSSMINKRCGANKDFSVAIGNIKSSGKTSRAALCEKEDQKGGQLYTSLFDEITDPFARFPGDVTATDEDLSDCSSGGARSEGIVKKAKPKAGMPSSGKEADGHHCKKKRTSKSEGRRAKTKSSKNRNKKAEKSLRSESASTRHHAKKKHSEDMLVGSAKENKTSISTTQRASPSPSTSSAVHHAARPGWKDRLAVSASMPTGAGCSNKSADNYILAPTSIKIVDVRSVPRTPHQNPKGKQAPKLSDNTPVIRATRCDPSAFNPRPRSRGGAAMSSTSSGWNSSTKVVSTPQDMRESSSTRQKPKEDSTQETTMMKTKVSLATSVGGEEATSTILSPGKTNKPAKTKETPNGIDLCDDSCSVMIKLDLRVMWRPLSQSVFIK